MYMGQRAYLSDLRFPGVSLMLNTVRAYGFHRFFADLRRKGTTINSTKLLSQLPNGRLKIGRSAFHMHPQLVKLEMGLLRRHTFPRGMLSDASFQEDCTSAKRI